MGKKLTTAQVDEIKRRLASGESQSSIAKDFPVGRSMIGEISRGAAWFFWQAAADEPDNINIENVEVMK